MYSFRAGAVFHPQSNASLSSQVLQKNSFSFYYALAKHVSPTETGVQIYPMTEYFDDRNDDSSVWYRDFMPDYRVIPPSQLPEGVTFGVMYTSLAMNPHILLPWLKRKLLERGVNFVRAEVNSLAEARRITGARITVNASGVGAQELAGDEAVKPVRGQTMFVKTDIKEVFMKEGSEYTYVIPRFGTGGVILGGIKTDRLDLDVDIELKSDILRRVNRITNNAFIDVDIGSVEDIVAFRPGRKGGLRVEREGNIIHAYGVEGAGYIYSFGIAGRVKELIDGKASARL